MIENKTTADLIALLAERDERIAFLEARLDRVSKLLAMPDAKIAFLSKAE